MNTIKVYEGKIISSQLDDNVEMTYVSNQNHTKMDCLKLYVKETTSLSIVYEGKTNLLDIKIDVSNGCFSLEEIKKDEVNQVCCEYHLFNNSEMHIYKLYNTEKIKEEDTVFLEGEGASVYYHLHTLAMKEQFYNIQIYHNAVHTNCYLNNKAVVDGLGEAIFHVTNKVIKGMKNCVIEQNTRMITLNQKKGIIVPILLIDENEVDASHSAHIGTFDEESLFYLQSRGIPLESAIYMLIKGFLIDGSNHKDILETWIDQYWR